MSYHLRLAQRIREKMEGLPGFVEKKMFGGVGFLLHGNMACGVSQDDLIVRVGVEEYKEALTMPYTKAFDMTGRPMKGWVMVSVGGLQSDEELSQWLEKGVKFTQSLPSK